LRKVANRQTDRQTDRQQRLHIVIGGGNYNCWIVLFIASLYTGLATLRYANTAERFEHTIFNSK